MKRKLICLLLVMTVLFPLFPANAMTFVVSHTTYDTTYDAILKMYIRVINAYGSNNVGRHDLFNDSIYDTAGSPEDGAQVLIRSTKNVVGYCLWDINQDGIDELLIGYDGGWIHEIFTIDNSKVRELIKAGAYGTASSVYSCALLENGMLFRHAHDGPVDFYELWEMNGTGPLNFVEGYYSDGEIGANETGDPDALAWFRLRKHFRDYQKRSTERVERSVGESWLKKQESGIRQLRFVPFSVLEKMPDDPWNIAMLSVNGSTKSAAKVKVRKEANENSRLVASKDVGTYVRVLSKENGYFKIAFGKKEGYVRQEFLTPLTYKILQDEKAEPNGPAEMLLPEQNGQENSESQGQYPINGRTNSNSVNIRKETEKKSKLVATIKKKGSSVIIKDETTDSDGVVW